MADHKVQNPPSPSFLSSKHTLIMEKLKNSVLKVADSHPNAPLSPPQIAFIERQLLSTFPVFLTPTHPPYSSMIENAVKELNEEDGSNEESISKYIKENYDGLPWAHGIYVSHHLSKMRKNGEIICTPSKLYTAPALIKERNLRKEQQQQRFGRKTKECVSEEGDSGGESVVEVSGEEIEFQEDMLFARSRVTRRMQSFVVEDVEVRGGGAGEHSVISSSKNLGVEKCDEVGMLEDAYVTERNRVKRRRRSHVVVEEDDELEGVAVVAGEQNISSSSQKLVVEKSDEVVMLEDGDDVTGRRRVEGRSWCCVVEEDDEVGGEHDNISPSQNLVEKCNKAVMLEEGDDLTGKVSGSSKERGGIGTLCEDHDLVNVLEEPPSECQYDVKSYVFPLDDECEGKTKQELLVPSSVRTLHAERECENTNEMVNMLDDNSAAELVLVPVDGVECENSSLNAATVSNITVDVLEGAVIDLVLKKSECMIVPFEGNAPISAVSAGINPISKIRDPIIICGLAIPELEQPKRKQQVYFPKRRLKACQEKKKVCLDSTPSFSAATLGRFLLERAQLHKLKSQNDFETKLELSKFKEISAGQSQQASTISEQLERHKWLDPLHHPSSLEELISVEDEENLPLQQVFEKCGKRKKHAAQILTENAPLASQASSIAGSKLHVNLPTSEKSMRMLPIIVPDALIKKNEKQPPQQRRQRKANPQDQKLCNLEANTTSATESKTSPWRNRQRCVDQEPQIAVVDYTVENLDILHQHQQQGQDEDQESSLCFELTAETNTTNFEVCNWTDSEQTSGDHDFCCEQRLINEVTAIVSSPTKHLNGQVEELIRGETNSFDTDLVTTAVMQEKGSTNNEQCHSMGNTGKKPKGQRRGLPKALSTGEYLLEKLTPSQSQYRIAGREGEGQCLKHHDPEIATATFEKRGVLTLGQSSLQPIDQPEGQSRRPFKLKEEKQETTTTSLLLQHELHWQQERPTESATNFIVEETSSELCEIDKIKSHELVLDWRILCPEVEPSGFVATEHVVSANLESKQEKHQKQPVTKSPLSEPSLQNREHQTEDQGKSQNDVRLLDPDVTVATFVEENVPTANHKSEQQIKLVKRELRSRLQKQLETRTEDVVFSSTEHLQQQKVLSKPAVYWNPKQKKKYKEEKVRGRPLKQKGDVVDSRSLYTPLLGLSEPSTCLHALEQKKRGRGRPPKQREATTKNSGASSVLLLQQQKGLSEPEIYQYSQLPIVQPKKNGRGRPRKQKEVTKEDEPVSLNLYLQSQEWDYESLISPDSPHKVKLLEKNGFGKKQVEAIKEDAEASSNLQLQEESKPVTDQHLQQHTKQVKKEGGRGAQKQLLSANEEASGTLDLHAHQLEGLSEPENGQHSQQQIKQLTKNGRVRRKEQTVAAKEDAAALSNLHKRRSRARPSNEIEGSKEDSTASMNFLLGEKEKQSEPETYQYPHRKNNQLKMELQRRIRKQHEETKEDPATAVMNLNLQEQKGPSELSTYHGNKLLKESGRERLRKKQVNEEDSAAPLTLLDQLEEGLSDQEKECKLYDCLDAEPELQSEVQKPNLRNKRPSKLKAAPVPSDNESRDQEHDGPDAKPEKSQSEFHGTPETGQAMPPSDDDNHRWLKKRKLHIGGQRPRTRALTTSSENQSDQQQIKQLCHEHEKQQGKFEVQSRPRKEKSVKIAVVPLASKDQLRSRVKRQSQDRT